MAFVDSTTNSGNSATPAATIPTGVVAGTWILIAVSIDATAAAFDPADLPAGFTELAEVDITADGQTAWVGWKRATGAEGPGSYTFGDVGSGAVDWIAQAIAFSGRHASNPPVISADSVQNTPQSPPININANGVTALLGDDLLWIGAPDVTSANSGNGMTPPASYTEAEDAENVWVNLSIAYRENVSAGATGTVTGVFAMSADTAGFAAWLVRLPIADAGPPGGYWQLEENTDRWLLEDGSGLWQLEETIVDPFPVGYGRTIPNTLIRM